jgi:large subunit ribosomal protein L25
MTDTLHIAESGRSTGSSASRRLRAEDKIPAVVYGHGMDPLSIAVNRRDLRQAVSGTAGMNTVLDLTVDGTVYPAIIKEMQRHPVRRTVQHVDFIQVNLDEQIRVSIPLHLTGEAKEVSANNGLVDLSMNELEISTTPRNIPDEIIIDITDFDMDTTVTIADVPLPDGVVATGEPGWAVVTVLTMRTPVLDAEEAEAEAAAAELADATEGEGGEADGDAGADAAPDTSE